MKFTKKSALLELHCIDPKHKQNRDKRQISFTG
jgi:hypothetical protein